MSNLPNTLPQSVAQSPLFVKLPPELRIRVYKYSVYGLLCKVTTAHGIVEPAILLTCNVVRKEAIGIFYAENMVVVTTPSFEPIDALLVARKDKILRSLYGCRITKFGLDVSLPRRWPNLLSMLRHLHAGNLPRLKVSRDAAQMFVEGEAGFIVSLSNIATGSRGRPWHEVQDIFVGLRAGLNALHRDWRKG